MAKEKKEQPKLSFDGKEYIIEDMSNESKQILNHISLVLPLALLQIHQTC